MSERCEQMSEWTSKRPSAQRVEFIVELVNFIVFVTPLIFNATDTALKRCENTFNMFVHQKSDAFPTPLTTNLFRIMLLMLNARERERDHKKTIFEHLRNGLWTDRPIDRLISCRDARMHLKIYKRSIPRMTGLRLFSQNEC